LKGEFQQMKKYDKFVASISFYMLAPVITCSGAVLNGVQAFLRVRPHASFWELAYIMVGIVVVLSAFIVLVRNSLSNRQYAEKHTASASTQKYFGDTAYLLYALVNGFPIALACLFRLLR
jgi:hypothetical protein